LGFLKDFVSFCLCYSMSIAGVQGGRLVGGRLVFIGTSHGCIFIALALIASGISIIQRISLHFYLAVLYYDVL
jgi:hypothetical protein